MRFWADFQQIINLADQLGLQKSGRNEPKVGKDFIAWMFLCVLLIADMWEGYLLNPNRGDGAASKCKKNCERILIGVLTNSESQCFFRIIFTSDTEFSNFMIHICYKPD